MQCFSFMLITSNSVSHYGCKNEGHPMVQLFEDGAEFFDGLSLKESHIENNEIRGQMQEGG